MRSGAAQVSHLEHQHQTMIEAVENHMPEALVRLHSPPVPCKQTRHASCNMFVSSICC